MVRCGESRILFSTQGVISTLFLIDLASILLTLIASDSIAINIYPQISLKNIVSLGFLYLIQNEQERISDVKDERTIQL